MLDRGRGACRSWSLTWPVAPGPRTGNRAHLGPRAPQPVSTVPSMALRAGIVVTGTEVLTGRVTDRNGPWLAEQLRIVGVDVGRIIVVGDRPADLSAALHHLFTDHDLVITSGGLGPTADDLTARIVGDVQGRPSR